MIKQCINCQKDIPVHEKETTNSFRYKKKMYCGNKCCQAFQRRVRNRIPHPPEVLAAIERAPRKPVNGLGNWNDMGLMH